MKERELKLALPGRFTLPELTIGGAPVGVRESEELSLRATYFDTRDLRLARHGVTLRHRTGERGGSRWTLKLPRGATAAVTEREELHFDGPGREPPAAARSLVTAIARGEPLEAVATLNTRRQRVQIGGPDSDDGAVAEVAIDEVSVIEGRRVVSRFRELEVEDLSGDVDLEDLGRQLLAAGATIAEPIPKVVRALGSRATAPPDVTRPPSVDAPRLADALRISIADALLRLLEHDPLARLGDPDGIHQVRVALRRLRSDLRTLGDAVDPAWYHRIEPSLRAIADALASARDLDVLIERVREQDDGSDGATALVLDLERRREGAQREVRAALESADYVRTLDALVATVSEPPIGPSGGLAAASGLPTAAMRSWKQFERRAERLDRHASAQAFHRTRIAAKRARYAAELASRVLSGDTASHAARLGEKIAGVQGQLGIMQDAAIAEAALRETLAGDGADPALAFAIGRHVERERRRSDEARDAFLHAWPKVRRRKWRRWAR